MTKDFKVSKLWLHNVILPNLNDHVWIFCLCLGFLGHLYMFYGLKYADRTTLSHESRAGLF